MEDVVEINDAAAVAVGGLPAALHNGEGATMFLKDVEGGPGRQVGQAQGGADGAFTILALAMGEGLGYDLDADPTIMLWGMGSIPSNLKN